MLIEISSGSQVELFEERTFFVSQEGGKIDETLINIGMTGLKRRQITYIFFVCRGTGKVLQHNYLVNLVLFSFRQADFCCKNPIVEGSE